MVSIFEPFPFEVLLNAFTEVSIKLLSIVEVLEQTKELAQLVTHIKLGVKLNELLEDVQELVHNKCERAYTDEEDKDTQKPFIVRLWCLVSKAYG